MPGDHSEGVPPVPIPNTEVKPFCADGTANSCGRVGRCQAFFINKIMKILLICPIPPEFKKCCNQLSLKENKEKIKTNTINNINILAVQTGPGKKNILKNLQSSIDECKPDLIIDTGSCCSLDNEIKIGSIIIAYESYQYIEKSLVSSFLKGKKDKWLDKILKISELEKLKINSGIQVCGSFVLKSGEKKKEIKNVINAEAFNWETAYVYEISASNKIPAISIRIVTDYGNKKALKDFFKNIKEQSKKLYKFIKILIEENVFNNLIGDYRKKSIEK